ncbi:MAG: helix-turn-helix domain-containing protein [Actinomycetota bacterium]|nr:helix-turn-helix domain-containing protein [Actinomycetota bacterium]
MEEVRSLRLEKGWNQNELAFHADLAPSVISLVETGKREPNAATLRKLANALDVEIPDLFRKPEAGKVSAPRALELEKVSEKERRLRVRGWEVTLEDLAARCKEAEEELKASRLEDFPDSAEHVFVLVGYEFERLDREAEEVRAAPSVAAARKKIYNAQAGINRILEQKFAPLDPALAATLDKFKAATAAASLTSGASTEEDKDERRGTS